MNNELSWGGKVSQRKRGHMWVPMQSLPFYLLTQTHSRNWHVAAKSQLGVVQNQARHKWPQTLVLPDVPAFQLLCHLSLSVLWSDTSTCPTRFLRDDWQRCWHLPSDLALQGFAFLFSIVGVGWEVHSHTLTHWQLRTECYNIISNIEDRRRSLSEFFFRKLKVCVNLLIDVASSQRVFAIYRTLILFTHVCFCPLQ